MLPPSLPQSRRVLVREESDVADAMRQARTLAGSMGFGGTDVSYIATAATELASNLLIHAGGGVFEVRVTPEHALLELLTEDQGPGIPDIEAALQEGFSTAGGLGCGLPGIRRLMDGLEISSQPGSGTRVRSWKTKVAHGMPRA